jgi:hypothetical protein
MFSWLSSTEKMEKQEIIKLIHIEDNKLKLNNLDILNDETITVISIIGTARTGKSTLLNCISSYLLEKNIKIFEMDDTEEHCTIGVDMYYCKNEKIVLLDCQGLKLDDSSKDPLLLLIVYLISDLIIYNQRSLLNNDIFETLQPLATFVNYIENIKYKPKLIFRILDMELKCDFEKLLEKTLSSKNDQYQNTRLAMINLFSVISLCHTNSLDKSEKKLLQENKFIDFMANNDNNFSNAIETILNKKISSNKTFNEWYKLINDCVNNINNNNKIDFNILDIYQTCVEKEILIFQKTQIDKQYHLNFSCGILQDDYIKYIVPKIDYLTNVLAIFNKRFNMANKKIYDKYYFEIKKDLDDPIQRAIADIEKRSLIQIETEKDMFFNNFQTEYIFPSQNNLQNYIKIYNELKKYFYDFIISIGKYYSPIVRKYIIKYEKFMQDINEKLITIENLQKTNELKINVFFDNILKNYPTIYDSILKMDFKLLNINTQNQEEYIKQLKKLIWNNSALLSSDIFSIDELNIINEINKHLEYQILIVEPKIYNIEIQTINITNKNYSPKNTEETYKYMFNKFNHLQEKINNDEKLTKIIKTKIEQNNLCIINGCKINNLLPLLNYNIYFMNNIYPKAIIDSEKQSITLNKKLLKQKLYFTEFEKYLSKKYNKKITINKEQLFTEMSKNIGQPKNSLAKLYKNFIIDFNLITNKIIGIYC